MKPNKNLYDYLIVRFFYIVGIQSVRMMKRVRRRIVRWVGRGVSRISLRITDHKEARKNKELRTSPNFRGRLCKGLNIALPVAATALLIFTVQYWMNRDVGLQLTYREEQLGTISREQVVGQAADLMNERLIPTDGEHGAAEFPLYQLTAADSADYLTPTVLCDKLIEGSDGIVEEATGLYVDGELIAPIKSGTDLDYLLQNMLNEARGGDSTAKASFVQRVESLSGLYSSDLMISSQKMKDLLYGSRETLYTADREESAEGRDVSADAIANLPDGKVQTLALGDSIPVQQKDPLLDIQVVKQEVYEQALPYRTVTQKDSDQYTDYSKVTQEGKDGKELCTDEVTYLNGKEVSRTAVTRETKEEAVDKIVVVGTKKKPVPGVATGTLMWPLPYTHQVVSGYKMRWGKMHNGIDISASGVGGQPILAADGGTVQYVKLHHYGYGYHLMIDHGNGMMTLYAHCREIYVQPGEKVFKGQEIAAVGTTGDSTGDHLHFEVYKNGARQDPLQCVQ